MHPMDGAGCSCLEMGLGDALALLAYGALPQHGWVRGEGAAWARHSPPCMQGEQSCCPRGCQARGREGIYLTAKQAAESYCF